MKCIRVIEKNTGQSWNSKAEAIKFWGKSTFDWLNDSGHFKFIEVESNPLITLPL